MNLDQVLVEADSSSSSDLEILDDTDDVVPDTGTDNTFQEAEDAKAIEERIDRELSELTEPEFDVDQQPQEEIDVEEQGNLLRGIVIWSGAA